jgi:hypothetical protein
MVGVYESEQKLSLLREALKVCSWLVMADLAKRVFSARAHV